MVASAALFQEPLVWGKGQVFLVTLSGLLAVPQMERQGRHNHGGGDLHPHPQEQQRLAWPGPSLPTMTHCETQGVLLTQVRGRVRAGLCQAHPCGTHQALAKLTNTLFN